jgi:hypothetical protein
LRSILGYDRVSAGDSNPGSFCALLEIARHSRSNRPMPRRAPGSTPTLLLAVALALFGCHQCGPGDDVGFGGDLVGGDCSQDRHCVERCLGGGDFPHGTCTVDCDHDGDCPEFTRCVDVAGGVCLLECDADDECRNDYGCHDRDRQWDNGVVLVCIDD